MGRRALTLALALLLPAQAWPQAARPAPVPLSTGLPAAPLLLPGLAPAAASAAPAPAGLGATLPRAAQPPGVLPRVPTPAARRAAAVPSLRAAESPAVRRPVGRPSALLPLTKVRGAVLRALPAAVGAESAVLRADFTQPRRQGPAVRAGEAAALPGLAASPSGPRRVAVAGEPSPARRGVRPFLGGTLLAQTANNALHVTLPLTLLSLDGSIGAVAAVVALAGWADALGTLAGGWAADRTDARAALAVSTGLRGAALLAIPVLGAAGALGFTGAASLFLADAFFRGVADTARYTVPIALTDGQEGPLKKLNGAYQTAFEAGGVGGPLLVGALLAAVGQGAADWLAPAAFAAAAAAFWAIPRLAKAPAAGEAAPSPAPSAAKGSLAGGFRAVLKDPAMRWGLLGLVALTLYPLRSILPAVFAESVLGSPASAAWLVALFGAGGLLGAAAFRKAPGRFSTPAWLKLGALGSLALAAAALPGGFWPMAAGILVFSFANVQARLSATSELQARLPEGLRGQGMGAARFSVNMAAMAVKFLFGLAFAAAAGAAGGFLLAGAGIAALAGLQWLASSKLARTAALGAALHAAPQAKGSPSPVHGLPGRLIVVEGLDGSGKSTQLELLRDELERRGLDVVVTTWNSSPMLSEGVKEAKRARELDPTTFSLVQAADLADRLRRVILPALREGKIVLADRYAYTGRARDRARGRERAELERLYAFAPRPDVGFFFKLPVELAVARVLARTQGRLGLSEDYEPEEEDGSAGGVKYYEGGLDVRLSEDPVENFKLFQARVSAEYDRMARSERLRIIRADRTRESQHAEVLAAVEAALGGLGRFKRVEPGPGPFDKDPAQDPRQMRENYFKKGKGEHYYYRNLSLEMQARFAELMDLAAMPKALLHGNPHVDNYAKTERGGAMADFDRSRVGPYAWDLVRLMGSIAARKKEEDGTFLHRSVLRAMKKGYLRGFRKPQRTPDEMDRLRDEEPAEDERSTDAYLAAGKKWALELRQDPLPADHPSVDGLLRPYLRSRGEEELFERYFVEAAGRGKGSMGVRDRYLYVLAPKDPASGLDRLMFDLKAVRSDPDSEHFKNPYPTQAERMRAASELHAPGWELRPGWAVYEGKEYAGRQIPPFKAKLRKRLDLADQRDFAYAVANQLGRAHRLSLRDASPEALEAHLKANFMGLVRASETMLKELRAAYRRYLARARELGLAPARVSDDD